MEPQRRVQVVLGEAERADGLLRFVLEAEGFDLVGLASNDEELARVLRGARPSVVVLDGGISAAAALHARERVGDAALVVVWPDGVSAVIAEERVEPSMVIEELGDAVRRAADRVFTPIEPVMVPEAKADDPVVIVDTVLPATSQPPAPRRRGRRTQTLIAAATWFLVLTSLAAIATAVPQVMSTFRRGGTEHPSPATTPDPSARIDEPSEEIPDGQQDRCDDAANANGNDRSNGNGVRAQGCPSGGQPAGTGDHAGGRPDDPGSQGNDGSAGNGGSNGGPPADGPSSGDDVTQGGADDEHGAAGQGTGQEPREEHGRAGEAGRSDQHG
jgi:hypothetical protein